MTVKLYHCISPDPPWSETGGGKIKRGADRHYAVMRTPEIARTILESPSWRPAADCHLWLWVTNNFLLDGLAVMERLGFRYVTNMVWVKDRIGLGQYLRGQHELCLFGVRGKQPSQSRSVPSAIVAPRGRHSEKPQAAYDAMAKVSPGPYLEMFARTARPGWDAWGNEAPEPEGDG